MDKPLGHDTISAPIRMASTSRDLVIALRERDTERRHEIPMTPGRWLLGKDLGCDFTIEDPYVSSIHAVLDRDDEGVLVMKDCDSKNGTVVDGHQIRAVELRPGAMIQVGKTYLIAVGRRGPDSVIAQLRGRDPSFRRALDLAIRASRSDCSILIVGETGTGKDLVARAVHEASPRAGGPFVPINCGAFPHNLIGAELFGHVRGAYTGAIETRDGVFVQAEGGTLFLDELGELVLDLQPHLLRVLETKRVRPIGSNAERAVDVRFVAATNRLDGLGTPDAPIRFDLYQRIAAVVVHLPPLRDRRADIPEMVAAFLDELASRHGPRDIHPAALDAMLAYDWPGNVRELRQTVLRAVTLSDEEIALADLALPASVQPRRRPDLNDPSAIVTRNAADQLIEGLPRHEMVLREMMVQALARAGTLRGAARELGMPKSTFADKAKRYGIPMARAHVDDE